MPSERHRIRIPLHSVDRCGRGRGSGFAARTVSRGVHFWKIQVFCGDVKGGLREDGASGFAVGFVADGVDIESANQRIASFVGISGDQRVWSDGQRVSGSRGVVMRNRDILNLCLDLERGQVLVQRIEYRRTAEYEHTVHGVQRLAIERAAIDREGCYKLGCYLKRRGQGIDILEYGTLPFDEWR